MSRSKKTILGVSVSSKAGAVTALAIAVLLVLAAACFAQGSAVSKDSIDLLTRTGRAMAEVTSAVKPAIK